MTPSPSNSSGFSLTEMVIAFAITTVAVIAATNGWIFMVRGERLNSIQMELDLNVRESMENLKHDLRLSSLDKIYYYPAGPGPYTAISFPMTSDTNGDGLAEMAAGGTNVAWTSTVIYHVWNGSPNELRKTTFYPRDNSLTPAQYQTQLGDVVTNGDGRGYANALPPKSLFKNLFTWLVWGSGATYDGYSPTEERDPGISFGSIYMGPGTHQVKFKVIGKNDASSGYKIGVDTLTASACGVEREGEAQLPVAAQSGAIATADYMAKGSWSGNYQLSFQAATTGAYFTLNFDNDRWEETNFRGAGALSRKTIVGFDTNPKDYIVQLEGNPGYSWGSLIPDAANATYIWTAESQSGSINVSTMTDNSLSNCVVRVLIRGDGAIRFSGSLSGPIASFTTAGIFFQSAAAPSALQIMAAYIAEANPTNFPNAITAGTQLYFWNNVSSPSWTIWPTAYNGYYMSPLNPFEIDSSKSYLITFLVGTSGNAMVWPENTSHAGVPSSSYIIPASEHPDAADAQAANWTGKDYYPTNAIFAVYGFCTYYPSNGLFTSQIFDTKIETPIYSNISWNATLPANTSLRMKVRTDDNNAMTNAPNWTNASLTTFTSSPANITCGNKRYIQFQAALDPDIGSVYRGKNSPKLKDVTIKWAGPSKIVDIAATMTKGPNYGICEVTVDGSPLTKGLRIDLSIFKDIKGWGNAGMTNTSSMTTEISPRNTGK